MKVCVVFGTRPEGIKVAPVVAELRRRGVDHIVVATAQHRELLDDVLKVLPMRIDYDLDIMCEGQSPNDVSADILLLLPPILEEETPDVLLVQGDTTSTVASALAAFYNRIPVAHIEAGLRTNDLMRPYPEEGNRRVVTPITTLHFAPTGPAKVNLLKENVPEEGIVVTGNTVVDALLATARRIEDDERLRGDIEEESPWLDRDGRMILVTAHRRESFGEPMRRIFDSFLTILDRFDDVFIVYPVHPNPNVRFLAEEMLEGHERLFLVRPLNYASFVLNMMRSYLILTDSGGIQEEAPSLDKPVLVLREVTERPEAVDAGCAKLVGTSTERIVSETIRLLCDDAEYKRMAEAENPFGDGKASERIVDALIQRFGV